MAPSLQGLIDFVLNEVALCGNQGAYNSVARPTFIQREYILDGRCIYRVAHPSRVNLIIAQLPD